MDLAAEIGILFGFLIFALTGVFVIAIQYRKYGRFTPLRLLGAAAVSVYVTTLVAYTLLPLPPANDAVCPPSLQLVPLQFIADIASDTAGEGVFATLASRTTLQVVFNVLLFIPLGVIVRGFFSRGLPITLLIGVGTSLFIELTQFTGNWGMYSCPYRVADVDDLIANTLGALLGGLLAPAVLGWMPREHALRAVRATPRPVTVWRRWAGMAIDFALFTGTAAAFVVTYRVVVLTVTGTLPETSDPVEAALGSVVPALLVFILPALRSTGASLGQTAMWLEPSWQRPASVARRLLRATSVGGLYGALVFLSQLALPMAEAAGVLANTLLLAAFVAVPFTRGRRGLSGLIAGAEIKDERAKPARSAAR